MPDVWLYVAGGVIISIMAFVIAYTMMAGTIDLSQRQTATSQLSNLYHNAVATVCIQEINNSMIKKVSFYSEVRVVYATD